MAASDPRFSDPGHPPATIDEFEGVRYLHLGTSWVQGAMRLSRPDAIELEYVQLMMAWLLFLPAPRHIAQLGLGCGALTRFCYRRFPQATVSVAELNPNVIAINRALFELPPNDARLDVREIDAFEFVRDPERRGRFDVLQIDLYDEQARAPVFDSPEFYQACAACLGPDGIATINVFGTGDCYERSLTALETAFDAVVWLPEVHDANVIMLAFKRAPQIDFSELHRLAAEIRRQTNLPAKNWVNALKDWMHDHAG